MRTLAIVLVLLAGCDSKEPEKKPPAVHTHSAPHGGTLVDLEGAHVELVFDRETGELNVYHLQAFVVQEVSRDSKGEQNPYLKMPLTRPAFVVAQFPR